LQQPRLLHQLLFVAALICACCCRPAAAACGPPTVRITGHSSESACREYNGNPSATVLSIDIAGVVDACVPNHGGWTRWTCEPRADGGIDAVVRDYTDAQCTRVKTTGNYSVQTETCLTLYSTSYLTIECPLSAAAAGCPPPVVSRQHWSNDFCGPALNREDLPDTYYYPLDVCIESAAGPGGTVPGGRNVIYSCTADGRVRGRSHSDTLCQHPDGKTDFDYPSGKCNGEREVWTCLTDEFGDDSMGGLLPSSAAPGAGSTSRLRLLALTALLAGAAMLALAHSQ